MGYGIVTVVKALKTLVIMLGFILALLVFMFISVTYYRPAEPVRLNEVLQNPAKVGWEDGFIELINAGNRPSDIGGWEVRTKTGSKRLFGSLQPGEHLVLFGEIAQPEGDIILVDSRGIAVDTFSKPSSEGVSWGRYPDGAGTWAPMQKPTPGEPNDYQAEAPHDAIPYMPDCMSDEFVKHAAQLRQMGYDTDAEGFCRDFRAKMFEASPEARRRISEITDPKLKAKIVQEVADRKIAEAREVRAAAMNVTDDDLFAALGGLLTIDPSALGMGGEAREMNKKFKNMLYDLAQNGTSAERDDLRQQIGTYLKSRDYQRKNLVIEPDTVRTELDSENLTICGTKEYGIC